MRFHSFFKKMRWAPVFALVCCGALTAVHSAATQELDGDPAPGVEATPKPTKVWDVGTPIDTGTAKATSADDATGGSQVTIDWNQTAQVSVEGAKDSDHWTKGDDSGTAADGITYQWSGQGTFASPDAASSQWTPPTLPSDNASFTYKLFCTVDDTPTPVGEGEGGTRDDDAPDHLIVEVKVTRKKWDVGSVIQLGGPITSDVTPQLSTQGELKLYVEQGQQVHLNIPTATDDDHWVYRDTDGTEPDEVNYTWSGANNLSSTQGQSVTWTAPFLPGQVGSAEIPLTCTVDDKPTLPDAAKGETGTRDDKANDKSTITLVVVRRLWSPNKAIGFHPQLDAQGQFDKYNPTWVADGQVVSPSVSATTHKASAMPGEHVACVVSEAHDWDSWTRGDIGGAAGGDWVEDSPLTYRWTATQGQFLVGEGENAQLQSSADTREVVWVAPVDGTNGPVTLTCTVDDPAGDRVNAPREGGSRDDDPLVRTVVVEVAGPKVTFTKLDGTDLGSSGARSCAGGIGLDSVHDFTILGTAKKPDGTLMPNSEFKLSFENNRGHDYSGDDVSIKPAGWKTDQIKKAKFVTTDENGNPKLVETLTVSTDDKAQFTAHVLSSDIVSSDIKIKVKRTPPQGQDVDAGEQVCDFEQAEYKRRFANPFNSAERYPDQDDGWLIQSKWLSATNPETTAKIYLKFMRNPKGQDADGNWDFVVGHKIMLEIESIETSNGDTITATDAYVVFKSTGKADSFATTFSLDGAATAVLQAGEKIAQVKTINLKAYDESQWSN